MSKLQIGLYSGGLIFCYVRHVQEMLQTRFLDIFYNMMIKYIWDADPASADFCCFRSGTGELFVPLEDPSSLDQ